VKIRSVEYGETSGAPLRFAPREEADAQTSLRENIFIDKNKSFSSIKRENADDFEEYKQRVMDLLLGIFSGLYHEVSELLWNDERFMAYVRRSYGFYDHDLGVLEQYLPTALNGENLMQFLRAIVKIVPEMDQEEFKRIGRGLRQPYTKPMGFQDSEMIFVVSKRGYARGFRHGYIRAYMTFAIVDKSPERAAYRILTRMISHLKKRLDAFVRSLKLPIWMVERLLYEVRKGKKFSLLYNLKQRFSLTVMTILENFIATINFLANKLRWIGRELGKKTQLKNAAYKLREIQKSLFGIKDAEEIREGVNRLIKIIREKLGKPRFDNEVKSKCSFIGKINKRASHKLSSNNIFDPYSPFRDRPEDLLKREKQLLLFLESQVKREGGGKR